MGEVYRARDPKLGRDVALKILPDTFSRDAEHLARFRREAQLLAALNHPHIAQIHGLEETHGTPFLVLELVDGETFAARISRGALPLDEALAVARQIVVAPRGAASNSVLAWFDRTGKQLAQIGPRGEYGTFQLSPDGKNIAFERGGDIWVLDIQTGVTSRLTTHPARDAYPVWSPDGKTIVFGSNRNGPLNLLSAHLVS
jgi:dipeptidyl aminopeptidase/acylaminoacyl peptidase